MNYRIVLATAALVLAACGSADARQSTTSTEPAEQAPVTTATSAASTTTLRPSTTTSTVTTTTIPPTAPLTGLAGEIAGNRVLIAKVSNAPKARPQAGIDEADMFIEVIVEGGVSRLLSFFQTSYPEVIGPVRSVREVDPKLIAPFDARVAHSGGQPAVVSSVRRVAVDEGGSPAYARDPDRPAVYDYMFYPDRLPERAWDGEVPQVLTFDEEPPAGAVPATSITVVMSSIHQVTWEYENGTYLRFNGRTPHLAVSDTQLDAATVVVVFADQFDTGRRDAAGAMVPDYEVTGTGRAIVFRDGLVVEGTWDRPSIQDFFVFFDEEGEQVDLAPGRPWFQLVPSGRSVSWEVS